MYTIKVNSLKISLGEIEAVTFMMRVTDLVKIQYVARRGKDDEPGAVQRVLSPLRLQSIEDYILRNNIFYTPFILNWVNDELDLVIGERETSIPVSAKSAQVLDGQHRIAGLQRAMLKDPSVGERNVLVIMTKGLGDREAAKIFLNINTEQRPVKQSLIYDLFGIANDGDVNIPTVRAKDIAETLNNSDDSPYQGYIKFPGSKRGEGCVDLSIMVSTIRPLLEKDGLLAKCNITNLENQYSVFKNFFGALKSVYDAVGLWDNKLKNPFLVNAGFFGAIDALKLVLPKCMEKKDFSIAGMNALFHFDTLLQRADMKNLDGKAQRKVVFDFLENAIMADTIQNENEYKF